MSAHGTWFSTARNSTATKKQINKLTNHNFTTMRKINFLLCGLIGLAMTACSGDEPNAGGKPDDKGDGKGESFIALNIVNANSGPRSRAGEPTGDNSNGDTDSKTDGSQ